MGKRDQYGLSHNLKSKLKRKIKKRVIGKSLSQELIPYPSFKENFCYGETINSVAQRKKASDDMTMIIPSFMNFQVNVVNSDDEEPKNDHGICPYHIGYVWTN